METRLIASLQKLGIISPIPNALSNPMLQKSLPVNPNSTLSASEPVISVSNLNHYFGEGALRKQVLFDINLEISAGEIVIMTGPSGSGKTTLLTLMGGLRSAR